MVSNHKKPTRHSARIHSLFLMTLLALLSTRVYFSFYASAIKLRGGFLSCRSTRRRAKQGSWSAPLQGQGPSTPRQETLTTRSSSWRQGSSFRPGIILLAVHPNQSNRSCMFDRAGGWGAFRGVLTSLWSCGAVWGSRSFERLGFTSSFSSSHMASLA